MRGSPVWAAVYAAAFVSDYERAFSSTDPTPEGHEARRATALSKVDIEGCATIADFAVAKLPFSARAKPVATGRCVECSEMLPNHAASCGCLALAKREGLWPSDGSAAS